MKFLERDLEQIIHEANIEELYKQGLFLGTKIKRQVRIGNYGICDLLGIHRTSHRETDKDDWRLVFTICELKQKSLSVSAFLQAIRYAKGLSEYLKKHRQSLYFKHEIRIVLIGDDLPLDSSLIYLPDFIPSYASGLIYLEMYTYSMSLNGLKFHIHEGYKLKNPGF